jgi:hypothetical protein
MKLSRVATSCPNIFLAQETTMSTSDIQSSLFWVEIQAVVGFNFQQQRSQEQFRSVAHVYSACQNCARIRTRQKSRSKSEPLKVEDMCRQISHFGELGTSEDCASKQEKTPEARTPEVNLGHPNQEATHHQISHFGNSALQRIVRASKKGISPEGLKLELPK